MSAYIVSQTHISVLVSAAMRFEVPYAGYAVTLANANEVGRDLWVENHASVNYRYDEHDTPDAYTFAPVELDAVSTYKQARCYNYQTCEHPTYEQSDAYRFITDLCAAITQSTGKTHEQISASQDYERAPWGIDDPMPEYIPDTAPVPVMAGSVNALPEPVNLPAWKLEYLKIAEHTVRDCEGCGEPIVTGDRFCSGCGADLNDLYGRILATDPDHVEPFTTDPAWLKKPWKEQAADVRKFCKAQGWKGISARQSDSYCWHVFVRVPRAHDWGTPCDTLGRSYWNRPNGSCAACNRMMEATKHLERILYRAFPGQNRTDISSDYHDATFNVSYH